MKKERKNNNGFTLIELLAVIVIMGILMMAAMPLVLNQIQNSKIKSVVSSIDSYVKTIMGEANYLTYDFTAENTIFAIPIECIELEQGGEMALGQWMQANNDYWAYVLVQYDSEAPTYNYAFTFKDSLGYSLYPTNIDLIKEKSNLIKLELDVTKPTTGLYTNYTSEENWAKSGFELNATTQLRVLEAESDGIQGDGVNTCTLCQKGSNYTQVEEEKNQSTNSNKYIMLHNSNSYFILNDTSSEIGVELYENNQLAIEIENSLITREDNKITVTGSNGFDGTYIIYEDGYVEKDGVVIAKSESKWVNLGESFYLINHNGILYSSTDGNNIEEEFMNINTIKPTIEEARFGENGIEDWGGSYYQFADFEGDKVKLENIYDLLALMNFNDRCPNFMQALIWLDNGEYRYWEGTGWDTKENNTFVTNAKWASSKITYHKTLNVYKIENNKKKIVNMNDEIKDGVYFPEEKEKYYYKDVETKNVFFVDDYPFAYEKGMTYREWINSDYSASTALDDYTGDYSVYIPPEKLDKKIEPYGVGHGIKFYGLLSLENLNIENSNVLFFQYCDGKIDLPTPPDSYYSEYGLSPTTHKFVGWKWNDEMIGNSFYSYDILNRYIQNDYNQEYINVDLVPAFEEK